MEAIDPKPLMLGNLPVFVDYQPDGPLPVVAIGPGVFRQLPPYEQELEVPLPSLTAMELRGRLFSSDASLPQAYDLLSFGGPFFWSVLPQDVSFAKISQIKFLLEQCLTLGEVSDEVLNESRKPFPRNAESLSDEEINELGHMLHPRLRASADERSLVVHATSAIAAVAATVAVDLMGNIHYRKCEWCGTLFQASRFGGREKRFCSPSHATQSSIKKSRDAARKRRAV